jgi:hypothetical protein
MKPERKLSFRQETREEQQEQLVDTAQTTRNIQEFASAEELLRHDAALTTVPPTIAERLATSTRSESSAAKPGNAAPVPWWKRLLG